MGEQWFWNNHSKKHSHADSEGNGDGDGGDDNDCNGDGNYDDNNDDDNEDNEDNGNVSSHATPQQADLLWMVLARCQDAVPVVRVRAIGTTLPTLVI